MRNQFPGIFTATWSNKEFYSGTAGAIAAAVLTDSAATITNDFATYQIEMKGLGYATVVSRDATAHTITMDTTAYTGSTAVVWCVSWFAPFMHEAYDRLQHDILYGVDEVAGKNGQTVNKGVQGLFQRTGDWDCTTFLSDMSATDTRFNDAHKHLALHLMFRNYAMQGGAQMKDEAWNHYDQYMCSLRRALDVYAQTLVDTYPNIQQPGTIQPTFLNRV